MPEITEEGGKATETDETKQTETTDESKTDDAGKEQVNDEAGTDAEQTKVEKTEEEQRQEDLPEWARTALTKANTEAASYRTKLREAEDKLKDAKTPEEVEAIIKGITEDREKTERELLIENVALNAKLPKEAWKRLTGKTREELEADAKELVSLLGEADDEGDEITLEGGLTPRNRDDEPSDPRELARKYGRGSKRR